MSLETLKTKVGLLIEKAQSGGNTDELEALIDNSGVLDSTEGTIEEKVEQLVDKAEDGNAWYEQSALWTDHFAYLFKNSTNVKKLPRLRFDNATSLLHLAFNSNIEEIDYYIDSPKLNSVRETFKNTSKLKHIVGIDISNATDGDGFFTGSVIEEIDEPLNPISMPSYAKMITFNGCNNLRKISFVAESIKWSMTFTSTVLSAESIQSIIDGLATVETAQTLTLHANTKILQSQVDSANAKGWTVAGGTVVSEEEYYG
jgi:hypothetical protein